MTIEPMEDPAMLTPVAKLSRDVARAAGTLGQQEARYLVSTYYDLQDFRMEAKNRVRAILKEGEDPHATIAFIGEQMEVLENQCRKALARWAESRPESRWALSIVGIGPVLAAGLSAHIDITRAASVSHIWRFAGLDPTVKWEKGQKRPWNADLKVICWKIGQSFVKVSGNENAVYGKVWAERKAQEVERNERGEFAAQAAAALTAKRYGKDTEAYKAYSQGKLPAAHLQARSERFATKLFLSHWHHVAYELHYGVPPAQPFAIAQLGHAHYLAPPNWPMQ